MGQRTPGVSLRRGVRQGCARLPNPGVPDRLMGLQERLIVVLSAVRASLAERAVKALMASLAGFAVAAGELQAKGPKQLIAAVVLQAEGPRKS